MKRLVLVTLSSLVSGCFHNPVEPTRCDQPNALNRGQPTECTFSRVAFYSSFPVPFPATVTLNGNQVGTITGFYPVTPPGNCSADFTAQIRLTDGERKDWNARAANGNATSGTVQASPSQECILVRVF